MRAKVFTLRFSPSLGRFDDSELVALQRRVVLEHLREHVVATAGETMLACVAVWQERSAAGGKDETAPPSNVSSSPEVREPAPAAVAPRPNAEPQSTPPAARGPAVPLDQLRAEFSNEQKDLFDRLRRWRARTGHDEGAPAYVVLTNRQLVEIVRLRPQSRHALGSIHGLGEKKIGRYGQQILQVLWPEAERNDGAAATAMEADQAAGDAS